MAVGREYCVYIMTDAQHTVIYWGVTNNLPRRVYEHRNGLGGTFTQQYNICKLVYYEPTESVEAALAREKQIRGGSRRKKIALINRLNPAWKDLYEEILQHQVAIKGNRALSVWQVARPLRTLDIPGSQSAARTGRG